MKKTILALSLGLAAAAIPATSQAQLTENWYVAPGAVSWLGTGNTERGAGYNPVTDKIYVVSRNGSLSVPIIDPADGTSSSSLDVTGIAGGTFPLNDVDVTDDGVIYGVNLGIDNVLTIYRWADESSAPTVAFTENPLTGRYGDALAVRGSGTSTEIFVGGNGSANIRRFTTADGTTFTQAATNGTIATGGATSWGGIMPRRDNTNIIYDDPGAQPKELALDGTQVDVGEGGIIGASFASGALFYNTDGDVIYGAEVGNVSPDHFGRAFDITAGLADAEASTINTTPVMGTTANGNAAGAVVFTNDSAMVVLSTNNGLGSYGGVSDFGTNANAPSSNVENWMMMK